MVVGEELGQGDRVVGGETVLDVVVGGEHIEELEAAVVEGTGT